MAANFLAARATEIFNLAAEANKKPWRGLPWQNVPHKCRRRAASHHRNRIPMKLRARIKDEIVPVGKRPSKKHKKRRSTEERLEKLTKKWMATHKWHAKRYHMTVIDESWSVPLTANEKHFRANYRSINTNAYLEDLSYWRCFEIKDSKEDVSNAFGQVIVNGVLYEKMLKCLETFECFNGVIYDQSNSNVLGHFVYLSSNQVTIWVHPRSQKKIQEILTNMDFVINDNMCLFRLLGPKSKEKLFENHLEDFDNVLKASLDMIPVNSSDSKEEITIVKVSGNRQSGFGAGFDIFVPKTSAVKLWIDLVHSGVHVGCLDSHEQLDIEVERLDSDRVCKDILLNFTETKSSVQNDLIKIVNFWTKEPVNNFEVIREEKALKSIEKALKAKENRSLTANTTASTAAHLVPIVIDMINGGTLDENSKIYFPMEMESSKFAKSLLEVPFKEHSVIGQVTAATYSQRRGFSSGLGLLSLNAIEAYLKAELIEKDAFTIAVEKEANGKYYIAKFRLIHN